MPDDARKCDARRLRLSLEDRLDDREQAELAGHLERCKPCREELERLAAASRFWGEARSLRDDVPDPDEHARNAERYATIGLDLGPEAEGTDDDDEAGTAWLRLLDPPDPGRPEMLGRLSDYEIVQVLGQGGMGVVLKAREPSLDRMVAIKLLNPALAHSANARRRFAREARAAAAVVHDHIVAIHAVDEFRGLPYLVMQFVAGRSLQERIDATGPLATREVLRIGMQAARALAAAHAQGVVHRDVKPANILLENCIEKVKLTDFGLARAVDDASLTQSGVIAGTPQYMAPEQARGEPVDARSDLFSLGGVLYAMISGRPPFRAPSTMAVLRRICDDPHRPVREIDPETPDWLAAIVDRLLAKEPARRYQTAGEVADLLEQGLAHVQQPVAAARPAVQEAEARVPADLDLDHGLPIAKIPPRRPRRRLALAAGVALVALASLGVVRAGGIAEVADLVATVLRIKTPEGTLVVKVDDPEVKVEVDNETLVIDGAGPKQIRVRTGPHRVVATRNGQTVRDEIISVRRGAKQIVAVDLEPQRTMSTISTTITEDEHPPAPIAPEPPMPPVGIGEPPHVIPTVPSVPPIPPRQLGPNAASGPGLGNSDAMKLPIGRGPVWNLSYSPDGKRLLIAQEGRYGSMSALWTWDIERRTLKEATSNFHPYRVVHFTSDGGSFVAGTTDGMVETGGLFPGASRERTFYGSLINDLELLQDGRNVVIGTLGDGAIFTTDNPNITDHLRDPGRVYAVAARAGGKRFALGSDGGRILVYEPATNTKVATLCASAAPVASLDYSPDGKLLASTDGNGTTRIWDAETHKPLASLGPFRHAALCVRFSPDGKTLAASESAPESIGDRGHPSEVKLWDVATHREIHCIPAHDDGIPALAFSPDSKILATGSMDQTVKFWDVDSGKLRETIIPGETGVSGPNVPVPPIPLRP